MMIFSIFEALPIRPRGSYSRVLYIISTTKLQRMKLVVRLEGDQNMMGDKVHSDDMIYINS